MNRILITADEIESDGLVNLRGHRATHLRQVLNAQPGRSVRVGILDGPKGTADVLRSEDDCVTLSCRWEQKIPPRPCIDILMAMPRPKVMKRLWSPLAMLGVDRIMLVRAWKVEKSYFHTHVLNPEFYHQLLINGLEQAGDTLLPRVSIHARLRPFLEDEFATICPSGLRLAADPRGDCRLRDIPPPPAGTKVTLAIGPEGGWTAQELEWLQELGFTVFSAGQRTLRSDIACIGLLMLVNEYLEEATY